MQNIENFLQSVLPQENIYQDEPMTKHTTFKIGGNANNAWYYWAYDCSIKDITLIP